MRGFFTLCPLDLAHGDWSDEHRLVSLYFLLMQRVHSLLSGEPVFCPLLEGLYYKGQKRPTVGRLDDLLWVGEATYHRFY